MVNLPAIRQHVIAMLSAGLSGALTYHGIHHTLDVTAQCLSIAAQEGISGEAILQELEVAALYHDTGFLFTYEKHEERGCIIAREQLPGFGLDAAAVDAVCALIMATRVPQEPANHLQQIICDADLDYLGREDFPETGNSLKQELMTYNLVADEQDWEEKQLQFLQQHHFFTATSRRNREPVKNAFIQQLLKNRNSKINYRQLKQ